MLNSYLKSLNAENGTLLTIEFKHFKPPKISLYYIMHGGMGVQIHFHIINKLFSN